VARHPLVRSPIYPDIWTAVYRLFDAAGRLLYVGIGYDYLKRWKAHAKAKDWWPDVVRRDVIWYDNRLDAAYDEARAITNEEPIHNDFPAIDPLGLIVFREKDRFGRLVATPDPHLVISKNATNRILADVEAGRAHALIAIEGEVCGALIPADWYEQACAALASQ
jgi:hypothetical protein